MTEQTTDQKTITFLVFTKQSDRGKTHVHKGFEPSI